MFVPGSTFVLSAGFNPNTSAGKSLPSVPDTKLNVTEYLSSVALGFIGLVAIGFSNFFSVLASSFFSTFSSALTSSFFSNFF